MSWLSEAWKRNRGAIGNFTKNISPLLAFTPLGIPGAAIAGGLGEAMRPGKNAGDILKAGASNAAIGAGARGAVGLARSAFAPGSSAAGTVAGSAAPGSEIGGQVMGVGNSWTAGPGGTGASSTSSLLGRLAGGAKSMAGSAMGAVKENPLVFGQIASGVLGAREQGAQNDLQRQRFDFEREQYDAEQKRKEELARLLAPLYQQMMQSRTNVPKNPYA